MRECGWSIMVGRVGGAPWWEVGVEHHGEYGRSKAACIVRTPSLEGRTPSSQDSNDKPKYNSIKLASRSQ